MDIAAITATLASIKTAVDIASAIKDADVSLEKAELKLKIAELISTLADAKISLVEIQELVSHKEAEIAALKRSLTLKEDLTRYNDAYYKVDDGGKPIGKPICSHCWEVNQLAVHLIDWVDGFENNICPACKSVYEVYLTTEIKT